MTPPREEFEKNWNESDFSAESFIDKSAAWGLVQAATAAAGEACVARAAAELERTNLNPPQRTRVLAAIRNTETGKGDDNA